MQLILAGCVSITSYLQTIVFMHVEVMSVIPTGNSFYTCRSDVIPTDNSFMHAEVTSPNTLNSSLSNFVMTESTSRFDMGFHFYLLEHVPYRIFHTYIFIQIFVK